MNVEAIRQANVIPGLVGDLTARLGQVNEDIARLQAEQQQRIEERARIRHALAVLGADAAPDRRPVRRRETHGGQPTWLQRLMSDLERHPGSTVRDAAGRLGVRNATMLYGVAKRGVASGHLVAHGTRPETYSVVPRTRVTTSWSSGFRVGEGRR